VHSLNLIYLWVLRNIVRSLLQNIDHVKMLYVNLRTCSIVVIFFFFCVDFCCTFCSVLSMMNKDVGLYIGYPCVQSDTENLGRSGTI